MSGFRLGKVFGVSVNIDWSWLLIFVLVTWSLASTFIQAHPEWTIFTQLGLALIAALLFFLSVLAHELAHSLVANARKHTVRSITMFLFGGVSNIQKEPTTPWNEFIITIVGPLTSFILGGLFILLGMGTRGALLNGVTVTNPAVLLSRLGPLSTIFIWLGSVNILLGFFNLIPGFPLDGGRVLRSILWGLTNNLVKATRWASWVGQAVAWMLILAGIAMIFGTRIPFLGTGVFNGMWIIFIGWFLQNAAAQSYRRVLVQDVLEDVPVKRMMLTELPTIPANMTAEDLVNHHIVGSDNRAFIVAEGDETVGLVTIDDIRNLAPERRRNTPVREIMTPSKKLEVVAPEENVSEAFDRLQNKDIRQLLVMQGNKIVGLLRRNDIVRWLELQSQAG
ncbi:MAG TPA: site-2 protease family protein [Anaerolineales bacterium]|nr:site-2 protease family protein [Anaerolineales bacterium]